MSTAPRVFVTALPCVLAFVLARPASASEPECAGARPWVELSTNTPSDLTASLFSDLRAGLRPNHIDVCEVASVSSPPLARVAVRSKHARSAEFSVDVTDLVTLKRVGRDLDLDKLPTDGRSLALAVTAEELLRASWAELRLKRTSEQHSAAPLPPPPEVRAIVDDGRAPIRVGPPAARLGGHLAFERFLGGQSHYGVDLSLEKPLGSVASSSVLLGVRQALPVESNNGSVEARGASVEARTSLAFLDTESLRLDWLASGRGVLLFLDGDPSGEASADERRGLVLTLRTGLSLTPFPRHAWAMVTTFGVGLPIRSVHAVDAGKTVTSASELELFASAGLAWSSW